VYKITELASENIESRALAINNSGQVAGVAAQHAFLWDPITSKELPPHWRPITARALEESMMQAMSLAAHCCAKVNPAWRVVRVCIVMDRSCRLANIVVRQPLMVLTRLQDTPTCSDSSGAVAR
jgi:hypothetical protein